MTADQYVALIREQRARDHAAGVVYAPPTREQARDLARLMAPCRRRPKP